MTILFNQQAPGFDHSSDLEAVDRAQPLAVSPGDDFIVLEQQDCDGAQYILVERRDLRALIEILLRC